MKIFFNGATDPGLLVNDEAVKKRSLILIFIVMLMDIIGITLLSPVAPRIVLRYNSSALVVTLIPVVYALGQFVAAPILGKIGDKVGRRPVLLVSLIGQALGYLIFGLGGSLWMLILGRLIGGITSGNMSTSSAYIADISKPEERSKNFAIISTAWSLGLIMGPALGGLFGQFSLETPAFVAGAVTLLNLILGFFLLPESLPKQKRDTTQLAIRDYNPILAIIDMAVRPGLGAIIVISAIFSFAFNGMNSVLALFMIHKFSADTWVLSLMMMLSGVTIALANSFLIPFLAPRFSVKVMGVFGLLGLAISSVSVFFAPFIWLTVLVNIMGSAMSAFIFPALTTLSIERVLPKEAGQMLGVNSAVGSLMNIVGPLCAGLVYDYVMVGSPYWMGAIVLVIAAYLLIRTASPGAALEQPLVLGH